MWHRCLTRPLKETCNGWRFSPFGVKMALQYLLLGWFYLSELTSLANQFKNGMRNSEDLALKNLQNAHFGNHLHHFEGARRSIGASSRKLCLKSVVTYPLEIVVHSLNNWSMMVNLHLPIYRPSWWVQSIVNGGRLVMKAGELQRPEQERLQRGWRYHSRDHEGAHSKQDFRMGKQFWDHFRHSGRRRRNRGAVYINS